MARKKHHFDATNENENKNKQSKSQLFNETDAKSVEISGYTLGHRAPQTDRIMQEHTIPTGVVDIDESVQLPVSPLKSRHRHHDSKSHTSLRPSENFHKEHAHLPPIPRHSHHHHQHHPHGHFHLSSVFHHFGHLSHHHHHRHHRHHEHEKEVETYDRRWWYMPANSVHAPKPWRPPEYHYAAPKWYESSSRQSKISMNTQESKLSPRKYVDCRCQVCKPSKEPPRGTKWIVNE